MCTILAKLSQIIHPSAYSSSTESTPMAKSKRARTPSAEEEADGAEQVIASQLKKKKKPEPSRSECSKSQSPPPSDYEIGSETDSDSDGAGTPSAEEEADGAEQVIASQLKKKKPEPSRSEPSKPQSPPSDYEIGSETNSDSDSDSDVAGQVHAAANAKPDAAAKEPVQTRTRASAPATAAKKTTPFQRVFSEEDELLLLTALQEKDAWADMDSFYQSVKDSLSSVVTKSQLQEKLKRMKKKFKSMAKDSFKSKQGHELEAELMKKVWGGGGAGHVEAGKAEGEVLGASLGVLSGMVGGFEGFKELGFSEAFLKKGMDFVGEAKRAELNARWFKLEVAAMELFSVKAELLRDQAKSILEALKQSDN